MENKMVNDVEKKKTYVAPQMQVVDMVPSAFLCSSDSFQEGGNTPESDGEFI